MIAKLFILLVIGTSWILSNPVPEKNKLKDVVTIQITASVAKDLYERIEDILKAYTQKSKAFLEAGESVESKESAKIKELLKGIQSTLQDTTQTKKDTFVKAVSELQKSTAVISPNIKVKAHKNVPAKGKENPDVDVKGKHVIPKCPTQSKNEISVESEGTANLGSKPNGQTDRSGNHNVEAAAKGSLKLETKGELELKLRSDDSQDKWLKLKQKTTDLFDEAQNTLEAVKKKSSVALQKAIDNYEILKQKGLQLIDEAQATSNTIKSEIVEAYETVKDLFKTDDKAKVALNIESDDGHLKADGKIVQNEGSHEICIP